MMHDRGKSDSLVVPTKPPNNAGRPVTEGVEGSGRDKGNSPDDRDGRTQTGPIRRMASSGYVRQQDAEGNSGSPR